MSVVPSAIPPALLNIGDVLTRLGGLGPPSEIRAQSPALAATALDFERVILSSIENGILTAGSVHTSVGRAAKQLAVLRGRPQRLDYPLIEGEIMRRRRAQVVRVPPDESRARCAFAETLEWSEYTVAPIVVDGSVVGFFHGDRDASGRNLEDSDATSLALFATCFAIVYERAVLRHRLRIQHQEMRQVANWADARTSELGERSITLDEDVGAERSSAKQNSGLAEPALRDLLTPREVEVLKLMARGETNVRIAQDLVLSEGTVKFHVKNILRKLHASNRAEAASRYLRLTLHHGEGR
jgi:DNA-binding CsgD family transcriptional regulator